MASGATRATVIRQTIGLTVPATIRGLVGGVFLVIASHALLSPWAVGDARDPLLLCVVAAVLLAVASFAVVIPAIRGTSSDPMRALRTE
jgi:hypothetical protein